MPQLHSELPTFYFLVNSIVVVLFFGWGRNFQTRLFFLGRISKYGHNSEMLDVRFSRSGLILDSFQL